MEQLRLADDCREEQAERRQSRWRAGCDQLVPASFTVRFVLLPSFSPPVTDFRSCSSTSASAAPEVAKFEFSIKPVRRFLIFLPPPLSLTSFPAPIQDASA